MLKTINKKEAVKIRKRDLLDIFESIPGRIELLREQDRAFVNLFLSAQKFRNIALTAGVNEATIARRLKKIAARLTSNDFVQALSKGVGLDEIKILRAYFIDGVSKPQIARQNNLSYHVVQKIVKRRIAPSANLMKNLTVGTMP
jgi:DNA invertase Pin-like site-specific DNA recombinase